MERLWEWEYSAMSWSRFRLPDFYNTDPAVTLSRNPFGYWSIMDAGPYVNNANAPIGYTAYERSYLGWLKLKELTSPQTVKLDPISNKDGELAAIVRSPRNRSEYFIWRIELPTHGIQKHTEKEELMGMIRLLLAMV